MSEAGNNPPPAPNRHWFRFSLRTFLVGVAILGGVLAWAGYHMNWIRQRRMITGDPQVLSSTYFIGETFTNGQKVSSKEYASAPWPLSWLGESGYVHILLKKDVSEAELMRVRRLFPEAEGVVIHP